MSYDRYYSEIADAFGSGPEKILVDHRDRIPADLPVLDLGCGQGRNALYLAAEGRPVDAIDPSQVAVDAVAAATLEKKWPIRTRRAGFANDTGTGPYGAVLVFGLIQILNRDQIFALLSRLDQWLPAGGLVFATAFTTADPGFARWRDSCEMIGRNSFRREDGEIRTYLEPGELAALFPDFSVIHVWEGMGAEHRHGEGELQRHGMTQGVFARR